MHRLHRTRRRLGSVLILVAALAGTARAHADAVDAVQVLRAGGCGGILPAAPPLHRNGLLDRVAGNWARGRALASAAKNDAYRATATVGVRVSGEDASLLQRMRRSACRTIMDPTLREVGFYRAGIEIWLVMTREPAAPLALAPPAAPASQPPSPKLAMRALELVNEARARGTRCGNHSFAPAPPVKLSGTLGGVAFGHAADMADHGYFDHEDLRGESPADRVRAVGYRERLVGENIAYGPATVEEVVRGWLESPDHCENIMDPRFAEMGIGSAAGRAARHGFYWVQLLAEPRA